MKLERITVVPGVCGGRPIVRGTRIAVSFVLKLLASELSPDQIVREYPELQREDIQEVLRYAAWLASEQERPSSSTTR